ncbi:ExbD/TolR family protein [Alloalcanivorax xenomutans]|uniref:Biopolymer transporter ExbD n=1 Tax=Alloalcanivorax xenomutans TaxID=1094342 RepID=A0A9Q3W3H4_9GAMM|nr:biopolymer transporter ExbD [Alloalcanivorax xenomutans]ERS14434.1 biopolymer transporter ExbD [Alcanivorax sp. PN-3]KYZ86441.1 biopolymer transporter ExbD [Alcanivorax sp. KX64203]MBA4720684.1 biopolymer transporter ExbD [Alcanivorax sp.]ARB46253.1 biopolymer transporter ExbD [Alloalcanivorax xenomutans]MCE7507955.1 biopolymer transporter ExbD [Alloalcanivorax xenomutans]
MKFPRPRQEEISVNLTPLIDVVFLLLIFFMVSTTFTRETQLSLTLPEAQGTPPEQAPQAVEILVSSAGEYVINGEKLIDNSDAGLRSALLRLGQDKTEWPMLITADAYASYQAVVTVMDVAGQLGFDKLSLTTREAAEEGQ